MEPEVKNALVTKHMPPRISIGTTHHHTNAAAAPLIALTILIACATVTNITAAQTLARRAITSAATTTRDIHPSGARAPAPTGVPRRRLQSPMNILRRKIISVSYHDMPLQDVLRDIKERLAINLLVMWPAVTAAGFNPDESITLTLNDVSARTVLQAVLTSLSPRHGQKLTYRRLGNVLIVKPVERTARRRALRLYYVTDLAEVTPLIARTTTPPRAKSNSNPSTSAGNRPPR